METKLIIDQQGEKTKVILGQAGENTKLILRFLQSCFMKLLICIFIIGACIMCLLGLILTAVCK